MSPSKRFTTSSSSRHVLAAAVACGALVLSRDAAAAPFVVYDDALSASYANASFGVVVDFEATSHVHSGADAISVNYNGGFGALYLFGNAVAPDITQSGGVEFWADAVGQSTTFTVRLYDSTTSAQVGSPVTVSSLPLSSFVKVDLLLSQFGVDATSPHADSLMFESNSASAQGTVFFDSISLLDAPSTVVDAGANNDAGTDAGTSPVLDAGIDSGTPPLDAGSDSGTDDGGSDAVPDGGSDAGPVKDAGATPNDAGTRDAGSSSYPDASTVRPDAGDNDLAETNDSGCGCVVGMGPLETRWSVGLPLLCGALALARRRKKQKRSEKSLRGR